MNKNEELRVMSVMAHQDDFEFNCGGAFARLQKRYGEQVKLKILTTTRGASGHHISGLEETFQRRNQEAHRSAAIIKAEYECLSCLDGSHPHAQVFIDRNTLGGLWNAIRKFQPHYIFCPPHISDPLAGIHIDHYNTAGAVRMVAYQLTVPHAYPVMNGVAAVERGIYPVILNVDDAYAGENAWHLFINLDESEAKTKADMALSHESQIFEWLPWNGERAKPSKDEYLKLLRKRHTIINQRYGLDDQTPREFFRFTCWGHSPCRRDAETLFQEYRLSESGRQTLNI